jgi:hypothetical protein
MELLENFNFPLCADDVLRGQGLDPEIVHAKKPALLQAASAAVREGFTILRPAALIHKVKVVEHRHERILLNSGKELVSPLVARHLAGAEQVALAVCTIGAGLEELAATLIKIDPLLALALDGMGNAAVEKTAQQVCRQFGEQAQARGWMTSGPLSPGEPEWPVGVGQPQIFALLDPSRVGVTLTSGGMMIPKKSISFVVGIGPEMVQTDLCELCSLRERCRYRHV